VESAVSTDGGKTWNTIVAKDYAPLTEADKNGIKPHVYDFAPTTARLLKIVAQPETSIPSWHQEAAGEQTDQKSQRERYMEQAYDRIHPDQHEIYRGCSDRGFRRLREPV